MSDNPLQNRATEIIKHLVLPDAEDRVTRSYKQWNQIVRDHIRTETGLRLSDGDNRFAIPVRIVRGFPVALAKLIDQYGDPVMWRLIIGQPKLGGMIEGLHFLLQEWDQFENWPSLPEPSKNGRPVLDRALEISASLQHFALAEKVKEQIRRINEDILGVYRFGAGQAPSVDLYWLPIAMVAAMLDVAIEDLTVVVLIHELAHGYTQLGRDIDGESWSDIGFSKSDLGVVEGLAQFYTEVISGRLSIRNPSLFLAYQRLLSLQSGPYLVHQDWLIEDRRHIGEAVRFALVAARSHGTIEYDEWRARLHEARRTL